MHEFIWFLGGLLASFCLAEYIRFLEIKAFNKGLLQHKLKKIADNVTS